MGGSREKLIRQVAQTEMNSSILQIVLSAIAILLFVLFFAFPMQINKSWAWEVVFRVIWKCKYTSSKIYSKLNYPKYDFFKLVGT